MTQDEYDDLLVDEHYEKKGRFASGPDDDPYPGLAKKVHTSPREPDEDFDDTELDIRFCNDCGREIIGDFCGACREHERRRDDPLRAAEEAAIQRLNKTNFPS